METVKAQFEKVKANIARPIMVGVGALLISKFVFGAQGTADLPLVGSVPSSLAVGAVCAGASVAGGLLTDVVLDKGLTTMDRKLLLPAMVGGTYWL